MKISLLWPAACCFDICGSFAFTAACCVLLGLGMVISDYCRELFRRTCNFPEDAKQSDWFLKEVNFAVKLTEGLLSH